MTTDVAVVGAGPAGLALARTMQASGARVRLVGEDPAAATGPGVALPVLAEHYATLCRDLGRDTAREWWQLAVEGAAALRDELVCPRRRGGAMLLPANEAEYREMEEGLRALTDDGFQPRMMSAAAATNYLPVDAEPGALYFPGAVVFDPAEALQSLARGLESAPPGPLEVDADGIRIGDLRAEMAVLAEGAQHDGRWLFPLRGQILETGPVRDGMTDVTVAVSANRGHEVYREAADSGLMASGINPGSGPKERTEDLEVDPVFQEFLEGFLRRRFPDARAEVKKRRAACYRFTADGLPLVGSLPGQARVHVLAGFGASPWSLAVGAGRRLGALLAGQAATLPPNSSPRRYL